ncbi:hypothetical protein ACIBEJ_48670 [Nonomuraea sp. NPDC050790]|uniref:hypothetical protein n=1 Tax=Nonomuraea sp. NPDC050790 TaxID=3364371 RepID=UPI0037A1E7BA
MTEYVEDVDDFLDGYQLPEDEVPICRRGDLQARFEELERALDAARRRPEEDSLAGGGGEVRRLAQELMELREEMQSHVRVFRLRALPRLAWKNLLKEHPPRQADLPADHNRDSFPVAALAACAVRPRMTGEKAGRLVDALTQGQWGALWETILQLNGGSGEVPFSAAASGILSNTSRT